MTEMSIVFLYVGWVNKRVTERFCADLTHIHPGGINTSTCSSNEGLIHCRSSNLAEYMQ